jgi:hypothetical protein
MSSEYANISHSWTGGERQKLDICIGEVLVTCQKMVEATKKEREDRARHQRDPERQRARELEARERREEYFRKSEVIKKAAESLELSQPVRRLVVCLGSTSKIHELSRDSFGANEGPPYWPPDFHEHINWLFERRDRNG